MPTPRLPQVGGDKDNWGSLLNDFLNQAHTPTGMLKDGIVAKSNLSNAVQDALDAAEDAIPASEKGTNSGIATLTSAGHLTAAQIPAAVVIKSSDSANTGKAIDAYTGSPLGVTPSNRLFVDVKTFGATGDGVTDDSTAINDAVDSIASTGGTIFFPAGIYSIGTRISLRSNVSLLGVGATASVLKARSGLTTGVLVGTSGSAISNVTISDLGVDGSYSTIGGALTGIQATNCSRVTVTRCRVINAGGQGIAFKGLNSGSSRDCAVIDCYLKDIGQADPANGFGILLQSTHYSKVQNNWVYDAHGMSIGGNAAQDTGSPVAPSLNAQVEGNYLEKSNAVAAYEHIGFTDGCEGWVVRGNHSINSKDNGISASSDRSIVQGNWIDSPRYHGILLLGGRHSIVSDNWVRNPGQAASNTYSGIRISDGNNSMVMNNRFYDDQGASNTMKSGVTELGNSTNMTYMGNRITGAVTSEYALVSASTTQFVAPTRRTNLTVSTASTVATDATTSAMRSLNVTTTSAFTIGAPTNPFTAATITYQITNASGAAMGTITWNAAFKLAGTFTNPASTKVRTITFQFDGTNWIELHRAAADI